MTMHKSKAQEVLYKWFQKAPAWQKDMFCAIWRGVVDEEQLVKRAIILIDQEQENNVTSRRLVPNTGFPNDIDFSDGENVPIVLKSISDIHGVGALSATTPLEFGSGLTVVYGENGCGKSTYVKVLKASENPARSNVIMGNIFSERSVPASATLIFEIDGADHEVQWNKTNTKKYPLLIYDTEISHQFVDKANEVIYEPKVLSTISKMASVFSLLATHYQKQFEDTKKKYSPIETDIADYHLLKEFDQISTMAVLNEYETRITWNESADKELFAIISSLGIEKQSEKARNLKAQKALINKHLTDILALFQLVGPDSCKIFLSKRQKQIDTKHAADNLTKSITYKSKISHFGGDNWKNMWASSMKYAAILEENSPNMPASSDGLCVLCQQPLNVEAQERFLSFNEYTTSQVYADAETAYKNYKQAVRELQEKIESQLNIPEIEMNLTVSGIPKEVYTYILNCYRAIFNRCEWLLNYGNELEHPIPNIDSQEEMLSIFKTFADGLDTEIKALEQTAENREKQILRKNELLALQWVINNIPIKRSLIALATILGKCKTNSITTLKKDLSDILITESYIARFSNEMSQLDTRGQIKVELTASGAKKGRVFHQISLKGSKAGKVKKTGDVLSEGEYRVVSLAAFLADISSWGKMMPFIFDDPITSLDHKFEERVAQRLIELSTERQVIVFTHRLVFAQFLNSSVYRYNAIAAQNELSKRAEVKHIELRNIPLGQPVEASYIENISFSSKLNTMLNTDLHKIKQAQDNGDYDLADSLMRSLCTQFRNIVERGIEQELLSGVVQRFNRNVSTLKLPRLYALSNSDISLFDKLMTKYSYFDHSQSLETPITLPSVEGIKSDLDCLIKWSKSFKKRCEDEEKKAKGKK